MEDHFQIVRPSMQSTPLSVPTSSFFPTPTELSVSFRWLREHPVMAAATCAAATAVSMAAYFALQPKQTETTEFFDAALVAHKTTKRGESDASDYPTEKDSTLSLGSMAADFNNAEPLSPLEPVPEKSFNQEEYESESPEWGWYVSTTPPEEMYAPYPYKSE